MYHGFHYFVSLKVILLNIIKDTSNSFVPLGPHPEKKQKTKQKRTIHIKLITQCLSHTVVMVKKIVLF